MMSSGVESSRDLSALPLTPIGFTGLTRESGGFKALATCMVLFIVDGNTTKATLRVYQRMKSA